MRRWVRAAVAVLVVLLLVHVGRVLTAPPMQPLRDERPEPDAAHAPVDDQWAVARRFAPWILHETSARFGRQDIPAAMDFDGDRDGSDSWDDFPRYEIIPTVYYTVVETSTHWFVTYHLFHPRDWSRLPLGLGESHEGDGENLQVVASKATSEPVLLVTQAHFDAWGYAPVQGDVRTGEEALRGGFEVVLGHPVVYVERGGHGIYGSQDPRAANRLARIGEPVQAYRPALEGERLREPAAPWNDTALYRLVSLPAFLDGSTDHPGLFARDAAYDHHPFPRFHRGDRYAGPFGPSRGISPFALGFSWSSDELGALFFDPAATLARAFEIEGEWATEYVEHPFR